MITSFNKLVGNQSNEQNLEGATMMDFLTSCNETALNADKTIEAACGKMMRDYWEAQHRVQTSRLSFHL